MSFENDKLTQLKKLFFDNVFDHTQSSIRAQFSSPTSVDDVLVGIIEELLNCISTDGWDKVDLQYGVWYLDIAFNELRESDSTLMLQCFEKMIQLVGSTRSKIITDLKASRNFYVPTKYSTLVESRYWDKCVDARNAVFEFFSSIFYEMVGPMYQQSLEEGMNQTLAVRNVLNAVNIATWQSYTRQEQAKRSGHSAEQDVARFLASLGVGFEPIELLTNPMCGDPTYMGESFDILIPNSEQPALALVSTVHSSNIGQYGESKTGDLLIARNAIATTETKLVSFADGVGFSSNTAGLTNVLTVPHLHTQYRTLWKLAMAAEVLGLIPNETRYLFQRIHRHHPENVHDFEDSERALTNPVAMQIVDLCNALQLPDQAQSLWEKCDFGPPAMIAMRENECAYTYPANTRHPEFAILLTP